MEAELEAIAKRLAEARPGTRKLQQRENKMEELGGFMSALKEGLLQRKDLSALQSQLSEQRRTVDFDTYDIILQQLLTMLENKSIDVAPVYQRQFRWDEFRCSQLIESFFLGIPVPSLFMATNSDATWELVDGVQRISTLVKFAGNKDLQQRMGVGPALRLTGLEKLTEFEGMLFSELPETLRLHFETRPAKVVTLSDKSDLIVRFDLFERLNTGGVALSEQEIRDCVFRGEFSRALGRWAEDANFNKVVRLTKKQERDGTKEECVLRFFAFLHNYKKFVHSVKDFLNNYMREATASFDYETGEKIFRETFAQLAQVLPHGITRPKRKGITPLNLYEGVAVGAALAIQKKGKIRNGSLSWLGSPELRAFTTGATNSPPAVQGRIEFCRDKFMGK